MLVAPSGHPRQQQLPPRFCADPCLSAQASLLLLAVPPQVAPPAFEFTLVSRERLSFALHAAAVARHPRSVSHRWGAAGDVRGLDTDARAVSFADDSSITFDLLVAADGVRSRVRTLLAEQGRVRVTQQPEDEFKVKSFLGEPPAAPSVPVLVEQAEGWTEEVEDAAAAWRTALHWCAPAGSKQPRAVASLFALLAPPEPRAMWQAVLYKPFLLRSSALRPLILTYRWYSDDSSGRPILLGQPHWDGRMLYSLCLPTQEGWDALGTAEALQARATTTGEEAERHQPATTAQQQ